jgi:hypothetical protein
VRDDGEGPPPRDLGFEWIGHWDTGWEIKGRL